MLNLIFLLSLIVKLQQTSVCYPNMVAHEGQAVFVKDPCFKSEFHFHVQFESI